MTRMDLPGVKATRLYPRFILLTASCTLLACLGLVGCSLLYTRPVQDMSDTASSIRAAKEVQADVLAPELYRQATEWFFQARKEYKMKNFQEAREYARKARHFAEQAEYEVISAGAKPTDVPTDTNAPPPDTQANAPGPSDYAIPTGTPIENMPPAGGASASGGGGAPSAPGTPPADTSSAPGTPNPTHSGP